MRAARVIALWAATIACGCSGNQSALDPSGAPALHIEHLIIGIVALCSVIWLAVMLVLGGALWRRRQQDETEIRQRRLTVVVTAAVAATVVMIAGMTVASFYTTRGIGLPERASITITVRGAAMVVAGHLRQFRRNTWLSDRQ